MLAVFWFGFGPQPNLCYSVVTMMLSVAAELELLMELRLLQVMV